MGPHTTGPDGGTAQPPIDRLQGRFQLLSETLRAFAEATSDPGALIDAIVRRTAEALGDFCAVLLLSEDGTRLVPAAMYDRDAGSLEVLRHLAGVAPLRVDDGHPLVHCLTARGPVVLTDFTPEALRTRVVRPEDHSAALQLQIRAMVVAPLRAQGAALGTLTIVRHGAEASPFEATDLQLAQCLADHAALAITNARLFAHAERELAERRRAEERLRLLTDLSHQFAAATHDLQALLDLITRRIGEIIGQGCALRLLTSGSGWLEHVGSAHHPDASVAAAVLEFIRNMPQRVEVGVSGRVVVTQRPVVVAEDDPERIAPMMDPRVQPLVRSIGLRGFATVPLKSRGAVIGVISIFHTRAGQPYTEDDLILLEDVAAHAALAISNARLFADSQRQLNDVEKAERALHRTEQQLRQSQKMEAVGRLAGGIAHDFNNLLSVVLSYCSMLIAQLSASDPMRADLEEVLRAGERAADLTRQLLAFSRQQVFKPRTIDLNAVFTSMDRLIRRVLGENITLQAALEPALGKIKGDPSQLEQVIMNLVVNARDAMPDGGVLNVSTHNLELDEHQAAELAVDKGEYVKLRVADSGTGMDEVTQQHIFEPFFTTKEKGKGTGLGLSTVFGIVKQSGGSIWVDSAPGSGAVFHVLLRRTFDSEPPSRQSPALSRTRGAETVLLVEDEDPVRTVVRGILERSGYRVLAARNGPEAVLLAEIEPERIHLLLTDVRMPHMNGRELAERLQPLRPDMRVLYMSGYTDDALLHDGVLAARIAFLAKPITPDALLRKLREVLDAAPQPAFAG